MPNYPHLLSEGKIGNLTIRNRVVMSPMDACLANTDGTPNDAIIAYYVERARGGVGLIINGLTRVDNDLGGVQSIHSLALTSDEAIPAFKKMTDAVHAAGAKMFCQLHHPGRETMSALNGNNLVVSASAQACGFCVQPTRALTVEEIHTVEKKMIDAAVRAKKAGYDGIELHCAHGYLLQQFLSPYTNHRTDEYGGSFENRLRMLAEIITGVKEACGRDYPVSVRLSADEFLKMVGNPKKGLELDITVPVSVELEKLGVDIINVSAALYETANCAIEPSSFPEGWRAYLIKAIKDAVSIPVMGVSIIRHPEFAEKLLAEGNQDFIVMGRTFLADPEWVKKIEEGREGEIRKCISCLHCFETYLGAIGSDNRIECALNPRTAHESIYGDLKRDGENRTVVIVGAGPGGMEAARVLALRGFKPVIFEKNSYAGGQLNFADKAPMKMRIEELIETMQTQLTALGVEIHFNHEVCAEEIRALNPYAVILSTGAAAFIPDSIPGIHADNICSYTDVLSGKISLTGKKVAVVGGGHSGLETAHLLATQGNEVSVVEMAGKLGPDMYTQNIMDLQLSLAAHNVKSYVNSKLLSVDGNVLHLQNIAQNKSLDLEADNIVIALGVHSVTDLAAELEGLNVQTIGDCVKPGKIGDATRAAYEAVSSL